jgi:ABC-2 type transport system ATP-binding protein
MSTGQQHRLAVLLAFVAKPPLICLDEPTAGLDPPARRAVAALIQKAHADGATVVLSTHDLGEAETLCHRVAVLDRGRLKALGTPMELVSQCQAPAQITTAASLPPALLRRLPGVIGVLHPGPYLRLETRTVADTVAALVDLARAQRVALDDLTVRQPSLEDAFFELTAPSELRE